MRWTRGQRSGDIEDARSSTGRRPGGLGLPIGIGRGAGGGLVGIIVVVVIALLSGGSSFELPPAFDELPTARTAPPTADDSVPGAPDPEKDIVDFVSFVIDDVNDFWEETFRKAGRAYERAPLVLFRAAVQSGCGPASADTGPFYCPLDRRAYIDLSFFRELSRRFQAPGDFAQAYVIAHEIGHHVQRLLGVDAEIRQRGLEDPSRVNELSIRQELQADCLAGVWAHSTYERGLLEAGDLEEGLTAAAAVGDDRIQAATTGRVNPETWTHGSSEQRVNWFRAGFDSGDVNRCDTFTQDI